MLKTLFCLRACVYWNAGVVITLPATLWFISGKVIV
jgi:hypothetical protein